MASLAGATPAGPSSLNRAASGDLQEDNRSEILHWLKIVDERLAIVQPMEHSVLQQEPAGDAQEIEELVRKYTEARRNRDFALSDRIRKELNERGVLVQDTREGTKWRRK